MGGSFTYSTLGAPIEMDRILNGKSFPSYSQMAAYVLHTATGISQAAATLKPQNDDGLFYSNGEKDYYLMYKPNVDWLRGNEGILNGNRPHASAPPAAPKAEKPVVFGPGKYIGQRDLTPLGVTFCQLPYEIHRLG